MKSWYNLTYFYKEIKKNIMRKCLTLFFVGAITKMILQEKYSRIKTAFSREIEREEMFSAQKCPVVAVSRGGGSALLGQACCPAGESSLGPGPGTGSGDKCEAAELSLSSHSSRSCLCSFRELGVIPRLQANVFSAKF